MGFKKREKRGESSIFVSLKTTLVLEYVNHLLRPLLARFQIFIPESLNKFVLKISLNT